MRLVVLLLLIAVSACQRSNTPRTTNKRSTPSTPAAPELADYSPYIRQGVVFFAVGNAPDWGLIIQPDRRMYFRGSPDSVAVPTPEPVVSANGERTYEGRSNGNWIKATLRPTRYISSPSGQAYEYTVQVNVRKGRGQVRTYTGGGTALNQLMLLSDNWRIISLNGKVAPAKGKQPVIEFQPSSGRVTGTSTCNRFSGTFRADNQTVKLSPLAATKMACLDESSNAFENELFKSLTGTLTYVIERGQLTLSREGRAILVARRRD